MQQLAHEVLSLQPRWTHANSPDMQRRGILIRHSIPEWLEGHSATIKVRLGAGNDLSIEGRDGTGRKSELPWVRISSESRSPSAHEGWYVVYLFRGSGTGFYVALCHGSTRWENGEFKPRSSTELTLLVEWAKGVLAKELTELSSLLSTISLEGRGELGAAYERGTVCATFYPTEHIPDDAVLLDHLSVYTALLAKLYFAEDIGYSLEPAAHQAQHLQRLVESISAPLRATSTSGQGLGLTYEERKAIELHAMRIVGAHLAAAGYKIHNVSSQRPYDYTAARDGEKFIIEVKGTTGRLNSILLTANEIAAHREMYPNNALFVLHSIELARTPKLLTCDPASFQS